MIALLVRFGYLAVFLGTLIEGETFILLGGFLAHRGYLGFWPVVASAALGAFLGDELYFMLGRRYGRTLVHRSRRASRLLPWLEQFMVRYHTLWIFLVRYLYGMRWLAAAMAGSARVGAIRFALLALPACLIWAILIGLLGYGAGEALERLLGDLKRYEAYLVLAVVAGGLVYGLVAHLEEQRLARGSAGSRTELKS